MGIKGLWREVQPICRTGHVSQFRGQRIGIDTYCWLHRAVIGCALELSTGKSSDRFLSFIMSRVDMLLRFGVTPVLVFDGDSMPMKRSTDEDRRARRESAQKEAARLLASGDIEGATRLFEKGMEVSAELAYAVIAVMRDRDIECIVAPYEADAQLAYLCKQGYIQAVISEDSDLIAYNCYVLIAKLDYQGNCDVVMINDLPRCPSFHGLSYESFLVGCVMSGCDYVASLSHVGIKTAFRFVAAASSISGLMASLEQKYGFTKAELRQYESRLQKAFYCFMHHQVYDPVQRRIVTYTPLPSNVPLREELVGARLDDALAVRVCGECTVNPTTLRPYEHSYLGSVQLYFRYAKRGQKSLREFAGFEKMRAAKVTAATAPSTSDPRAAEGALRKVRESGGGVENTLRESPRHVVASPDIGSIGQAEFTTPIAAPRQATGFCGGLPSQNPWMAARQQSTRVISKYFGPGRVDYDLFNCSDDSGEEGVGEQLHEGNCVGSAGDLDLTDEASPSRCAGAFASLSESNRTPPDAAPSTSSTSHSSRSVTQSCWGSDAPGSSPRHTLLLAEDDAEKQPSMGMAPGSLLNITSASASEPENRETVPPRQLMATTPFASAVFSLSEQINRGPRMTGGAKGEICGPDPPLTSDGAEPGPLDAWESDHGSGEPRRGAGSSGPCPFGYGQCGRMHSIFERCYEGKEWECAALCPEVCESSTARSCGQETTEEPPPMEEGKGRGIAVVPAAQSDASRKCSGAVREDDRWKLRRVESADSSSAMDSFADPTVAALGADGENRAEGDDAPQKCSLITFPLPHPAPTQVLRPAYRPPRSTAVATRAVDHEVSRSASHEHDAKDLAMASRTDSGEREEKPSMNRPLEETPRVIADEAHGDENLAERVEPCGASAGSEEMGSGVLLWKSMSTHRALLLMSKLTDSDQNSSAGTKPKGPCFGSASCTGVSQAAALRLGLQRPVPAVVPAASLVSTSSMATVAKHRRSKLAPSGPMTSSAGSALECPRRESAEDHHSAKKGPAASDSKDSNVGEQALSLFSKLVYTRKHSR